MRVVTRRTGLSAELLRVWERRYGVVTPGRTQTGRRLYSDGEIERLRLLYRATLSGRTIGLIAKLSTPALIALLRQDAEADRPAAETGVSFIRSPATRVVAQCLRAVERFDVAGLAAVLRRAAVALSAATFLDTVVVSLLERVGTPWREGTLRPLHGHLVVAAVRRVLDHMIETASTAGAGSSLLVATPVGQSFELDAMLVAAAAAAEGWSVTYLGTSLSAEDIADAATSIRARAVTLSLAYPPSDRALRHEIHRLRSLLPKTVVLLVEGAASSTYAGAIDETGSEHVADLAAFRTRLATMRRRPR
jgi:DNA-binding transcriptional MerR regulator/methylmalonyl-CoA mutase cobalamin-binding subunit